MYSSACRFLLLKTRKLKEVKQRPTEYTVSKCTYSRSTKYRYAVLLGDIKLRCRTILIKICEAKEIQILRGVVSKGHVQTCLSYRPSLSVN